MGLFQNHMMAAAVSAASTSAYTIDNSCRFNEDDTAYLSRTPSSDGNKDVYTISLWCKRANLQASGFMTLITAGSSDGLYWNDDDIYFYTASGNLITNAKYRDPSAWYHIVIGVDTSQTTEANRIKLYVNGTQVTSFSTETYPTKDANTLFNDTNYVNRIGYREDSVYPLDAYLADVYLIDGTQYAASDFGEINSNGVWIPKDASGLTFGTNGFLLNFESSGDLGNDVSGNNNDLISGNLDSTDQRSDTPTSNRMTYNPLQNMQNAGNCRDGNRVFDNTGSTRNLCGTTFHFTTGKVCQAFSVSVIGDNDWDLGLMPSNEDDVNNAPGSNEDIAAGAALHPTIGGVYYIVATASSTGISGDTADTIWFAYDADSGKQWAGIYDNSESEMIWFDDDGSSDGDPANGTNPTFTTTAGTSFCFAVAARDGIDVTLLEESEATGTVPSGFTYVSDVASTYSTPAVTDSSENFQTELYTGDGTAIGSGGQAITFSGNSNLSPDFVWIKNRDQTDDHAVYDTPRGTTKQIETNNTTAETTQTEGLTTFGSDGFTVGSLAQVNTDTEDFVSWNWKESATSGVDLVTWTGNATNRTISHSLSAVPELMIVKGTSVRDWIVYHHKMSSDPETDYMRFDSSAASTDDNTIWNDTAPTSSVFSIGTSNGVNANTETYIGYLFVGVEGFSKFGSYAGNNNAAGPFIYCGFKPKFIIGKKIASGNWFLGDTARNTYNPIDTYLFPSTTDADSTGTDYVDSLSNGFNLRHTGGLNAGEDYIFIAFAENPFGGDGIAPVPAR